MHIMDVAKKYQDRLPEIKQNVLKSRKFFEANNQRFYEMRRFVFQSTLTDSDISLLRQQQKPQIEVNILEAYVSRLLGEFSKQEPSFETTKEADAQSIDPMLPEIINMHARAILDQTNRDTNFSYEVYKEILTGGFSVIKVYTDYANAMSMDQIICMSKCFDPTLTGFDPLAMLPSKGDGRYCFECFPKSRAEFEKEYPNVDLSKIKFYRDIAGFSFSYSTLFEDVLYLTDYYEKKNKKFKLVKLSDGKTMAKDDYQKMIEGWSSYMQPPQIVNERWTTKEIICRYLFIEDQVIDYEETDYEKFPLIFCDGNSAFLRNGTSGELEYRTRPYIYNAIGMQKLKNYAVQCLGNDLENQIQSKLIIAKEAIPKEQAYAQVYANNQIPNVIVFEAFKDDDPNQPLPPPREVNRVPAPPEVMGTISLCDQMGQAILGSYDASLGINNNQLSGVAIVEGATQSNAAAMPHLVGFMQGLTAAAQVILDLIPKYYTTPRTIPIVKPDGTRDFIPINQQNGIDMDFNPNSLKIEITAGVNFSIQKNRTLQMIIQMMQASPQFAQFINEAGLNVIFDNMDIRGIDQMKMLYTQWQQQQQQMQQQQMQAQANQPNPLQLKAQELALRDKHAQQEFIIQQAKMNNENLQVQLGAYNDHNQILASLAKTQAEHFNDQTELAMKAEDLQHLHTKDKIELAHNIMQSHKQQRENQHVPE